MQHHSGGHEFDWSHLHFWKKPEWQEIQDFIKLQKERGVVINPSYNISDILKPLELTPFKNVKILILGQDPYAKEGQADGIAFSSLPNRRKIPGSLQTIFKSYRRDTGYRYPTTGDLRNWCRNGVLLGNTLWTVESGKRKSHYWINSKKLWQKLTEEIIQVLNEKKEKMVFIFMGRVAQEHAYLVRKTTKHLVLEVPHPSPFNNIQPGPKFEDYEIFKKSCEFLNIDTKIWRLP